MCYPLRLCAGKIVLIFCLVLTACAEPTRMDRPTATAYFTITPTATQLPASAPGLSSLPTLPPTLEPLSPASTPDNDPAYYFGGMEITLDNAGQTIPLKKGQNFLLRLGSTYRWDVTVTPPELLSRNMKITPGEGEQGLYIARAPGKAHLRGVGNPLCRLAQPPCNWPTVLFQIQVAIE